MQRKPAPTLTPAREPIPAGPADLGQVRRFLAALDPLETVWRFRTFLDRETEGADNSGRSYSGGIAACFSSLERDNLEGRGVFVTVNQGGTKKTEITRVRAVWADTDGADLAPILACELPPHLVTETSPGKFHAFWKVAEIDPIEAPGILKRIAFRFGCDRNVCDVARVLRVAGFHHCKGDAFRVRIVHEFDAEPYSAGAIRAEFPALAKFPDEAKDRRNLAAVASAPRAAPGAFSPWVANALRRAAENVASAPEGGRNEALNREAHSLAGFAELADETIRAHLGDAARRAGLSDAEIEKTLTSGITSGRQQPRDPEAEASARPGASGGASGNASGSAGAPEGEGEPLLKVSRVEDLGAVEDTPPDCVIEPLLPRGHVGVLGAHGGTGKTSLAAVWTAHVACDRPWGPLAVKGGRVLFVSLEDRPERVWGLIRRAADHYGLDRQTIARNVTVLDGSGAASPALAVEVNDFGVRRVQKTAAMEELEEFAAGFDLIVIDNASDALAGNNIATEIVRPFVRGILGTLAAANDCAVLLLLHVSKDGAKHGSRGEDYLGSVAWNNSPRSRMAIVEEDGRLTLRHQKANLTPKAEPIPLQWAKGGILEPCTGASVADESAGLLLSADAEEVLKAIRAALASGPVTAARQGPCTTLHLLKTYPELPAHLRKVPGRFWAAVSHLERSGRIVAETYTNEQRKTRTRYVLPEGCAE